MKKTAKETEMKKKSIVKEEKSGKKIIKEDSILNNGTKLLISSLLKFYKNPDNIEIIVNIINRKTDYSLRILEWLCNNYSKKYNITYLNPHSNTIFNVYLSYKSHLDSYQKKKFDPFKRNHVGFGTFILPYKDKIGIDKQIETTAGQLNFLKWCIENNILEYVKTNLYDIKSDMNKYTIKKNEKSIKDQPGKYISSTPSKKKKQSTVSSETIKKNKMVKIVFKK